MKFRPCIDIHNGQVKQIVGSSLTDQKDQAKENFDKAKEVYGIVIERFPETTRASQAQRALDSME